MDIISYTIAPADSTVNTDNIDSPDIEWRKLGSLEIESTDEIAMHVGQTQTLVRFDGGGTYKYAVLNNDEIRKIKNKVKNKLADKFDIERDDELTRLSVFAMTAYAIGERLYEIDKSERINAYVEWLYDYAEGSVMNNIKYTVTRIDNIDNPDTDWQSIGRCGWRNDIAMRVGRDKTIVRIDKGGTYKYITLNNAEIRVVENVFAKEFDMEHDTVLTGISVFAMTAYMLSEYSSCIDKSERIDAKVDWLLEYSEDARVE